MTQRPQVADDMTGTDNDPTTPSSPHATSAKERRSVVGEIVKFVSQAIMNGDLLPGDRLIEADLAQQMQAGRGSVREALRRLEANKYITFEINRGARVSQPSNVEIRAMMRIRGVISGLGARAAAERVHLPEVACRVEELFAIIEQERANGNPAQHKEFNARFHQTINEMSNIPYVDTIMREVNIPMIYARYFRNLTEQMWLDNLDDHLDIARAIRKADPESAAHHAERHMVRAVRAATNLLDTD